MTQARELARRARDHLGPAEDMPLRVAFERALDDPRVSEAERAGLAWAIRATIERPHAASVDELSLAHFEDGAERFGITGRVTSGLSTLVERMASGLRVERSNPARSIAHSTEGVEVRAERGLWRGRAAIVCVPHGVLAGGQIAFEPSLPIGKREAIERIKSGALARVALRFSSAFWRPREEQIGVAAPWSQRGGEVEWTDLSRWGLGPTLVAVAAGDAGRALETRPERVVVDELCRALRSLFGEAVLEPEAVVRSTWSVDRFALGALSSLGVHGTPRDREALAAPVGHVLFFAGEATSRGHAGTVRGAYESGERAAHEVLAAMGLRAAER
jgi:monoamine oxidase